ncbi:MAG: sulfatase-like hydrolase/transferase, partial [Paracoccaceae bacterium]
NPDFCANGECDDGIFLGFLQETAAKMTEDTVIVLHQIGSHGPAYHVRYPDTYDVFQPSCQTGEFKDCSTEEITNAYDNTIAYTDHILAQTIDFLDSQDRVLPSLIYASDHGESLGENGLFLHGAPYFMAPEFQTKVPMLIWMSDEYQSAFGIDDACLKAKVDLPISHDNWFHSILGMMDIQTEVRQDALDLFAGCRTPAP